MAYSVFYSTCTDCLQHACCYLEKKDVRALHATLVHVANGNTKESKQQLNQVSSDFNDAKMLIAELETRVRNQADRSQRVMEQWAENESKLRSELVFKERQRIARELHDSVSQQLYAASMLLSAAVNQKKRRCSSVTDSVRTN